MIRKILIVDDNDMNRLILRKMLDDEYDILEAVNGKQALEILNQCSDSISAVLLDLGMPVMDGYEMLTIMRGDGKLTQIPVVVTTGDGEDAIEMKALTLGANDFAIKPYNTGILKLRLRNIINLREKSAIINAARTDALTGLLSRLAFFEAAEEMILTHKAGYYVMACYDIDKFKVINDQYGTQKGDEVLKTIASVFAEISKLDGICSRINADTFAALYPYNDKNMRIIDEMHKVASVPDKSIQSITFSVGRYIVNDLTLSPSAMYDRAALAKSTIKGRYDAHFSFYDEEMRRSILYEQKITSQMKSALENNEFEVWFQPQYNHSSGALIGAEALVRWRHSEKGLITPGAFIYIFERNGFIYELDKYVWENVCRQLRKWLDEGRSPLPISVNISRYDVFRNDLTDTILELMKQYDIPISLIRLEINEAAFSNASEQIVGVVKQLIKLGFTVAIDGFGSGFSSLNTLKNVPAQVVKLDMCFLEKDDKSTRGGNILESIVRMTKWLGVSVIAENVETIEQADFLASIGCNYIQGYLYSEPMTVSEYELLSGKINMEEKMLALETVKNLDSNAFWNPASLDTFIFNSFIGGACVFEYHNGNAETIRANDKYAQIIGGDNMTVDDVLNLKWEYHIDKANLALFNAAIKQAIETREDIVNELVFTHLPHCIEETYIRATIRAIASAGDRYLFYCTITNVTAQRKAEQQKREADKQLNAVMTNINGGISAVTVEPNDTVRFLFANDRYYEMLGYTREEFASNAEMAFNCIHPDDRERVINETKAASINNTPFSSVYRAIKKDGAVIWIQSNISITTMDGINVPVQIAVASEITEQIEADRKSHRIAEQMQAIMDNIGCGITAIRLGDRYNTGFLFANDRYFEIIGYTREQYAVEINDMYSPINEDDRQRVFDIANKINQLGKSDMFECRIKRRDGTEIWLNIVITVAIFDGIDVPVQLAIYNDIDAVKNAEQLLTETDEQLRFLNDTASDLLAQSDTETGINNVLHKLLSYFSGSRAYIFEIDYEREISINTYEVCAKGVIGQKEFLSNVPFSVMPFWFSRFANGSCISIDDIDTLDETRTEEREILLEQGIRSLVAVPLTRDGKLIGFIGIDDPKRRQSLVERLDALGDYLAVMLTRRDLDAKIRSDNATLRNLMNDTPGGFTRILVHDDASIEIVYANNRYCEMLGLSHDEVMQTSSISTLHRVHPDDRALVNSSINEMLVTQRAMGIKFRISYKNGDYIWFYVFGRLTTNENGETFINAYFADLSETEKKKMSFRETLPYILDAIMKSSSDLTFAKDSDLRYICCSERFVELTGMTCEEDVIGKTDYDLFEKEYADKFTSDDEHLINSGKSIIDMIEAIPSNDDYTHYSNTSKYMLRDNVGNYIGIYCIGRDITEYRTAYDRLQLLTNNIPGGIAMIEVSGSEIRFLHYNDGFFDYSGYSREESREICKKNPMQLVFEDDIPKMLEQIYYIIDNPDATADCTYRCHTKDGGFCWFNLRATVSEKRRNTAIINLVQFDVTEQKLSEEAVRVHEEEMKIAMSQMGKMICEYNPSTLTIVMPEAYAALYGLNKFTMNFPYSAVTKGDIDPTFIDEYIEFYESIISGKEKGSFNLHINRVDGTWHWEHLEFINIFDDDGKPIKTILSVEDITEQKEMKQKYEDELQLRNELIKDSIIFYELNLTTKTIDEYRSIYNDVPSMHTNSPVTKKQRQDILANVHDEDKEAVSNTLLSEALLDAYNRGDTNITLEYRRRLPKLGFHWVAATATIMKKPDSGNLIAFIYIRDIDRAKKDKLAIENIMDDEIESVIILDTQTGMSHFAKVNFSHPMSLKHNDYVFVDRITAFINAMISEDDKELCKSFFNIDKLKEALKRSGSYIISYRLKEKNGVACRKRTTAFYLDNAHREIVISTRDITDIYEEEQRQQQILRDAVKKANEASNAKSDFLSRMSHDIRTPLNAVLAFSGTEMNDGEAERQLRDNLDKIHASGNYLLGIINNVLDMSRIEQKKMVLNPTEYTFKDFKDTIGTVIGELCKDKSLDFELRSEIQNTYTISVDKVKFNQIFMNLLSNAVKFTPNGGKIELIISEKGTMHDNVSDMRFIVRDNGIGMSKEYLPHAFDSFSQEYRKGVSEQTQGTGLGLAIVKEIITLMGGTISVASELEKGTAFTIDLPISIIDYERLAESKVQNDDSILSGLHILLCEDNALNTEIAVKILSKKGCIMECAENGERGLEKFTSSPIEYYDVILMDIRMPVMNGIEAAEAIRATDRADSSTIPIIAMTADAFTEDEHISRKAGMNEHVSKPIEPRVLFDAIKRVTIDRKENKNK